MVSGFLGTAFRLALFVVARVGMMYSVIAGMGENGILSLH
jgi:hypothetical protein